MEMTMRDGSRKIVSAEAVNRLAGAMQGRLI